MGFLREPSEAGRVGKGGRTERSGYPANSRMQRRGVSSDEHAQAAPKNDPVYLPPAGVKFYSPLLSSRFFAAQPFIFFCRARATASASSGTSSVTVEPAAV